METITVPVDGLNVATCAQSIEKRVGAFSGVREVAASYVTQTVSITFDERLLGEATVRDLVRDCGFACGRTCDPVEMLALAAASNAAPPAHEHTHDHAMELRTDTSTGVVAEHAMSHDAGHAMGHDMGDPVMAAAMEADMRRRFWVALALTIPIVLYSSLGTAVLASTCRFPSACRATGFCSSSQRRWYGGAAGSSTPAPGGH